jgi:cell division protein FtsA
MSRRRTKGDILAALDVGSSKVACFIGRVMEDNGPIEVVGVGHQASRGVKAGRIVDMAQAEDAIRQAVHGAEVMAAEPLKGFPLRSVIVNIAGTYAHTHTASVDVTVGGHDITEADVRRAVKHAQDELLKAQPDWPLVHTMPANYMIDGKRGIVNPIGLYGDHLRVDVNFTHTDANDFESLRHCVRRSHLDLSGLCLGTFAAAASTMVEDEIMLGSVLIDMGGGQTSFAVFQDGIMIASGAVPMGGNHVTNDIASGLNISLANAERIKTLYGAALAASSDETDLIEIQPLGEEAEAPPQHVPRSTLIGIIQPRLEEILEHLRAQLDATGLSGRVGRRIVLTGGAAQMPGIRDLVHMILDRPVRMGKPGRLQGLPDAVSGPAFATTAGMLIYLYDHSELDSELLTPRREVLSGDGLMGRVKAWIGQNW